MYRILRDYLYSLVGFVASIVTLVLFSRELFPSISSDGRIAVIFIIILFAWFFLENIYIKAKWGRERKYSHTINYLNDGFSVIHKLARTNSDVEKTVHACERLCTNLADAYSLITGTKCNSSIKILALDKDSSGAEKLKTVTFARNHDSMINPKKMKLSIGLIKIPVFTQSSITLISQTDVTFFQMHCHFAQDIVIRALRCMIMLQALTLC